MQATGASSSAGAPSLRPTTSAGLKGLSRNNLPTPKEMIAHYESQGMPPQEASLKVIDDLQKLLFRVITTSKNNNLDSVNTRLLRLESKLDSKPGYPQTLAIGIASGAVFRVLPHVAASVAHIWNSVRTSNS